MSNTASSPGNESASLGIVTYAIEDANSPQTRARIQTGELSDAISAILNDKQALVEFRDRIFPDGISNGLMLYSRLANISHILGSVKDGEELVGALWASTVSSATSVSDSLLNALLSEASPHLFSMLFPLSGFIWRTEVNSEKLGTWLLELRRALGEDLASSYVRSSLKTLSSKNIEIAISILESWLNLPFDDTVSEMASCLMGAIRANAPTHPRLLQYEDVLKEARDERVRFIYYRSWVTTNPLLPIAPDCLVAILSELSSGGPNEREEALKLARWVLSDKATTDESFVVSYKWIYEYFPSAPSDLWKHFTISLVKECDARYQQLASQIEIPSLVTLLSRTLPIPKEHRGTWRELAGTLEFLLEKDLALFHRILIELVKKDTVAILEKLRSQRTFGTLLARLSRQADSSIFVWNCITSKEEAIRNMGFTLFDVLHISAFPKDSLNLASDALVAMTIFGYRLMPFYGDVVPRFLLGLLPRVENASPQLQALFREEVLFQCINYPGACLEAIKNNQSRSSLLDETVDAADQYFEGIKKCHNSAINAMIVPGLAQASRMRAKLDDQKMREGIAKTSIIDQIATKSYCLYGGNQWQTVFAGQLQQVSEMSEFSASAELPRLPSIDPEGNAIRRKEARNVLRSWSERQDTN